MKIELSSIDATTAEWWYENRQDSETKKFNPLAASTIDSLRERLSKTSSNLLDYESVDAFFWLIKVEDEKVGHLTMQNLNRMMQTAEIGYGVSLQLRGRQIGTRAVELLAKNIFTHTPLRKLIAFVHEDNRASRKLLEKVGFQQEGLLREHYLVNGKATNEVIYGLLRQEFIEKQNFK